MRLHESPFIRHGEINDAVAGRYALYFFEVRELCRFVADVFDDMIGDDQIEGTILERQCRAVHQIETIAFFFHSAIDYIHGVDRQMAGACLSQRGSNEAGSATDFQNTPESQKPGCADDRDDFLCLEDTACPVGDHVRLSGAVLLARRSARRC